MAHIDWLLAGKSFDIAEIGSSSATTNGAIALTLKESYHPLNRLHHRGGDVIQHESAKRKGEAHGTH